MLMKTSLFSTAALCAALFFAQPSVAKNNQSSPSQAMMTAMQSGMNTMMRLKMSGDADYDFATMMRAHHQSAVEMADLEIKQGRNEKVRELARTIKAANQREIREFDQFLSRHKPSSTSSTFAKQGMKAMHDGKHAMNGNPDHDFASMMAQHHQQAVDMSRAFLKEAKTDTMRKLANQIISQQTKEIAELKRLESSLKM